MPRRCAGPSPVLHAFFAQAEDAGHGRRDLGAVGECRQIDEPDAAVELALPARGHVEGGASLAHSSGTDEGQEPVPAPGLVEELEERFAPHERGERPWQETAGLRRNPLRLGSRQGRGRGEEGIRPQPEQLLFEDLAGGGGRRAAPGIAVHAAEEEPAHALGDAGG